MKKFNDKSKIEDILDDERAFEILEEIVPDFVFDVMPEILGAPPYEMIKRFTLKETIDLLPVTVNISKEKANMIYEKVRDLEDE